MKHVGSFLSKLAAYSIALLVTSLVITAQAQQQEGKAVVRAVRGEAQYSDGSGGFQPLKVGKILKPGAVIKTGVDGQVDLFLRQNGPMVRVTAESSLGLDKLMFEDTGADTIIDTKLNLTNGRILGNVKKLASASTYEVKIPTGTVGIRGTEYDISSTGIVRVVSGEVIVTYISPSGVKQDFRVPAGYTFVPPGTVRPTESDVTTEMQRYLDEMTARISSEGGIVIVQPVEVPVTPTTGKKK